MAKTPTAKSPGAGKSGASKPRTRKAPAGGSPADKILDGSAWSEFCDALKAAGAVIERELSPDDALSRAEGYRYLTRLIRLASSKFIEHADPATPRFYQLSDETGKIGCDNPDSYYQNAAIDGGYEYRLWGNLGTVAYLGLGTYYGHYGSGARSGCSGYLERDQIAADADGNFEIVMSCKEHSGNWLPLQPDSSMLIVRQNFLDRQRERRAEISIERIGREGPPAALGAEQMARALAETATFVAGTANLFADWAEGFMAAPNQLSALDPKVTGGAHGDPNIFYYMGYWRLAEDEALLVDVDPPECEFWNFQLNNHWMESLDYRYHSVHYNKHSASYRSDGTARIVVAHRDPGLANWVDTAGHTHGTMGLRWIKAASHPQPRTAVVKLAELASPS